VAIRDAYVANQGPDLTGIEDDAVDTASRISQDLDELHRAVNILAANAGAGGGETGPQGPPGEDGTDGTDGTIGEDGADGAAGATGPAGSAGAAGADLLMREGTPAARGVAADEYPSIYIQVDVPGAKVTIFITIPIDLAETTYDWAPMGSFTLT
jgi:hypothetical protein